MESTPTASSVPSGMPPQEGVILTGAEPPVSVPQAESELPISVPQTGSEPPISVPQADSGPQTIGGPPEGAPPDMSPPQKGVILTGGENTVHASQTENIFAGGAEGTVHKENTAVSGGERHTAAQTERTSHTSHTTASSERIQTNRFQAGTGARPTLGGMVFSHSLTSGGSFANDVIGTVARGEVAGSITGDLAAQSLTSYMGYSTPGIESRESPVYSDVEIGRGRITGVETAAGTSEGLSFAMYHVEIYRSRW